MSVEKPESSNENLQPGENLEEGQKIELPSNKNERIELIKRFEGKLKGYRARLEGQMSAKDVYKALIEQRETITVDMEEAMDSHYKVIVVDELLHGGSRVIDTGKLSTKIQKQDRFIISPIFERVCEVIRRYCTGGEVKGGTGLK